MGKKTATATASLPTTAMTLKREAAAAAAAAAAQTVPKAEPAGSDDGHSNSSACTWTPAMSSLPSSPSVEEKLHGKDAHHRGCSSTTPRPDRLPRVRSFSLERGLSYMSSDPTELLIESPLKPRARGRQLLRESSKAECRASSLDSGMFRCEDEEEACMALHDDAGDADDALACFAGYDSHNSTPSGGSRGKQQHHACRRSLADSFGNWGFHTEASWDFDDACNAGVVPLSDGDLDRMLQVAPVNNTKLFTVHGEARYNNGLTTSLSGPSASGTTPNATGACAGPVSPLVLLREGDDGEYVVERLPLQTKTALDDGCAFSGPLHSSLTTLQTIATHYNTKVPGHVAGNMPPTAYAQHQRRLRAAASSSNLRSDGSQTHRSDPGHSSNSSSSGAVEGLNPNASEWMPGKALTSSSPAEESNPGPDNMNMNANINGASGRAAPAVGGGALSGNAPSFMPPPMRSGSNNAPHPPHPAAYNREGSLSLEEWSGCSMRAVRKHFTGNQHNARVPLSHERPPYGPPAHHSDWYHHQGQWY